MAHEIPINEDPAVVDAVTAELAEWGDLHDVDRYSPENKDRFEELLVRSRERIAGSLFSSALVSAHIGHTFVSDYDYGPNMRDALRTEETVRTIQNGLTNGDVSLHIDVANMTLFKRDELTYRMVFRDDTVGARLLLEPKLQTRIDTLRGKLGDRAETSFRKQDGSRGNYMWLELPFNDIKDGVRSPLFHYPVPALTVGRTAIANLFTQHAFYESAQGGAEHRNKSLAYGIWRLRKEDAELTEDIDDTASRFKLDELWANQFKQSVGSKAVHSLLDKEAMFDRDALFDYPVAIATVLGGWSNEEQEIYGTNPELYIDAARQHAERIGLDVEDTALLDALDGTLNPRNRFRNTSL